jgi:DNA-directed RNA polymerase specialized sigma subunit
MKEDIKQEVTEIANGDVLGGIDNTPDTKPLPKKRGRKPNPNKKTMYFSDYEEEMFRKYCTSTDNIERNKIFSEILYPVFTTMVESIIRRYGLFTPGEDFEDTFNDAMSHLISKVDKFNPDKNTKAYSYCGTICKNYVLHKRQKTQESVQRNLSYDLVYTDVNPDTRVTQPDVMIDNTLHQELIKKVVVEIQDMIDNYKKYELTQNDVKVGIALVDILENWDDIFSQMESKKYNKSQIDLFIKDSTMLNTKQIYESKKKFSNVYFAVKELFLQTY